MATVGRALANQGKGTPMETLTSYSWYPAYWAALGELDDNLVASKIYEALSALEQRQLSPVEAPEAEAIRGAERDIEQVRTQRLRNVFDIKLPA